MVKVKRSYPAPESLAEEAKKASGKYDKPDVVEQLQKDFYGKCYICGIDKLQDPQVEHLLPHENGKYPERKFDWDNLFWACGHCNLVKNQKKYAIGILNCCIEDPEQEMVFGLYENEVHVTAKNTENQKAVLAAILIEEVFGLKNTGMRQYKSEMRFQELNAEMNVLYDNLEAWRECPESKVLLRKLKALLRKESRFAAFKRNYIRKNSEDYVQLLPYIS